MTRILPTKKTIRLLTRLVIAVIAIVSGYYYTHKPLKDYESQPDYWEDKLYIVNKVIDGDTIELEGNEIVRLIGMDAPEEYPNEKAARDSMRTRKDVRTITDMGKRSTEFVKSLLKAPPAKRVKLEYDLEKKDKYGRTLAYVFVWTGMPAATPHKVTPGMVYQDIGENSYLFLNATVVSSGYAYPLTIAPNLKYAQWFKELYRQAQDNHRGLWSKDS